MVSMSMSDDYQLRRHIGQRLRRQLRQKRPCLCNRLKSKHASLRQLRMNGFVLQRQKKLHSRPSVMLILHSRHGLKQLPSWLHNASMIMT